MQVLAYRRPLHNWPSVPCGPSVELSPSIDPFLQLGKVLIADFATAARHITGFDYLDNPRAFGSTGLTTLRPLMPCNQFIERGHGKLAASIGDVATTTLSD